MAALIKKRAVAEYTQIIQQEIGPVPPKKLRIVKKSTPGSSGAVYINLLEQSKTSNEALQLLLRVSDSLQIDEADFPDVLKKLREHFNREDESAVRVKIIALIGEIGADASFNIKPLVDETINLIANEKSSKVVAQGLATLLRLGESNVYTPLLRQNMVELAQGLLNGSTTMSGGHNSAVQSQALRLVGALLPVKDAAKAMVLLGSYIHSQDARVRAAAFRSMLTLHSKGAALDESLFPLATGALKDDYETVRKESLNMITALGNSYPMNMVSIPNSDSQVRLIDAAFGHVCSAVCDLSVRIRVQATELLGTMNDVGSSFLHQTLDKKLMSNMRKKRSAHERAKEILSSGEWASGKRWGEDTPKEKVSADSVSLIGTGACGALVHGLEDEYLEVRNAAVESMCKLSLNDMEFAEISLDFLVDMFNDEIEEVRLKAISSLTRISEDIVLRVDQLETILGALEDVSVDVREGLHNMLGSCNLASYDCLQMLLDKLLDTLAKYPQDKVSTWGCTKRVGARHPTLVQFLGPQLLQSHPFLDQAEPNVEDPAYIAILILVFNAAQYSAPLIALFPSYTIAHYKYLRDTMPQRVPRLAFSGSCFIGRELNVTVDSERFLKMLVAQIDSLMNNHSRDDLMDRLKGVQKDLERLAEIDPEISATAQFINMFLGAQLLFMRALESCDTITLTGPLSFMAHLLQKCRKLRYLFSGLSPEGSSAVRQLCVKASALHLAATARDSKQSALAPCQTFLKMVKETKQYLQDHGLEPNPFTCQVFKQLTVLENDSRVGKALLPGPVGKALLPILLNSKLEKPPAPDLNIRMCSAVVLHPTGASDTSLKVTAGLIASVDLLADVHDLQNPSDLRLMVKYPDQRVHLSIPRSNHIRPLPAHEGSGFRLRTTVLLSHGVWSESCIVEVGLCLSPEGSALGPQSPQDALELCPPIPVSFAPKPIKRGI